jgi:hypothetical protein
MIVAARKPLEEIIAKVENYKSVMVAGCATCVAECRAGGDKEVEILTSQLRIALSKKKPGIRMSKCTIERQCEPEMIEEHAKKIRECDAVLSIACGVGVQQMAERFKNMDIYPGLNTLFMGTHSEPSVWAERCGACGNCILDLTGGICPVARCSKNLLNGPCGGTNNGKCEVSDETPCAWAQIVERLREQGRLDRLEEIIEARDWSTSEHGGPRRVVRDDLE